MNTQPYREPGAPERIEMHAHTSIAAHVIWRFAQLGWKYEGVTLCHEHGSSYPFPICQLLVFTRVVASAS